MMKTSAIGILMFAVLASNAFATAQYPDKLLYEGKEYSLHTNPMEQYFSEHPEKKPESEAMCTALWRGYVATFGIKDDQLQLTDIEIMVMAKDIDFKSVKSTVIPNGDTLTVDWFSGILVLPHGELVNYVHMGYGSTYSNYILLEIKKGKLTGKRTFDHQQYEEFKERQFQAYKETEAYRKQAEKLKKEEWPQDEIDSFLRSFVVNYTSEFLDEKQSSSKPDAGDGR